MVKRASAIIVLPTPPNINHKFISRTFVLTKQYRDYKTHVAWLCRKEKLEKFYGDVEVHLSWYRPAKRGDIDGIIKPVFDAMTDGGVWDDDKQINELKVSRFEDKKNPRMVVKIFGFVEK